MTRPLSSLDLHPADALTDLPDHSISGWHNPICAGGGLSQFRGGAGGCSMSRWTTRPAAPTWGSSPRLGFCVLLSIRHRGVRQLGLLRRFSPATNRKSDHFGLPKRVQCGHSHLQTQSIVQSRVKVVHLDSVWKERGSTTCIRGMLASVPALLQAHPGAPLRSQQHSVHDICSSNPEPRQGFPPTYGVPSWSKHELTGSCRCLPAFFSDARRGPSAVSPPAALSPFVRLSFVPFPPHQSVPECQ